MSSCVIAVVGMLVEVVMDNWSFGGLATKNGNQLEYLKSSARGRKVMQGALFVSEVRQFLWSVGIFLLCGIISWCRGGSEIVCGERVPFYLAMIFLEYFFIQLALTITRFFDGLWISMGVSYIAFFLMMGGIYLIVRNTALMIALLLTLCAAISVIGVKTVMGRMEESYYDKAD